MRRLAPLVFVLTAAAGTSIPALAATVSGNLTYGGLPVSSTFSTMQSGKVSVYSYASQSSISYSIPAADSYEIPVNLSPGNYKFYFRLTPSTGAIGIQPSSGDLSGSTDVVQIDDLASYTVDVALYLSPHATQPVDSLQTWPGTCACPKGARQPMVFTFAWEPVPLATRYTVWVYRQSCTSSFGGVGIAAIEESVQITQRTHAGEEYLDISVAAFDAGDQLLTTAPDMRTSDHCLLTRFTFNAAEEEGRPLHSTGQFVSQVASTPGVGTSFWSTDLTLTNPTSSDVTTTLYYTPRDADGLTSYEEAEVTVPAGACREWADVVGTQLAITGAGALEVASPALIVASRTFTAAAGGGAYGQGVIAIQPDQVLTAVGMKARAGGVMKAGAARSNLALNEVWGESATAAVTLMDRDGAVLGTQDVTLLPYSNTQINDLVVKLAQLQSLAEGQVEVSLKSGTGRIAATLFLADESDDPATVPLYAMP